MADSFADQPQLSGVRLEKHDTTNNAQKKMFFTLFVEFQSEDYYGFPVLGEGK